MVELQGCFVPVAGEKQICDRESMVGQILLDAVGERHSLEVVLALGAPLEQEFALVGDDDHFGSAAISAGQRFETENDADVVMAEDANKLLRRKMCTASGHNLDCNSLSPCSMGVKYLLLPVIGTPEEQ